MTHMTHKTNAGIVWISDYRYGAAKILVGSEAVQHGFHEGFFGKQNCNKFEQLVGDRMPEVLDAIKHDYDGDNTIGSLLAHRAANCLRPDQYEHGKNELLRFQSPDFASTWNAVTQTSGRLSLVRLQAIQEERILLKAPSGPGLYIRWNEEAPTYIYVGTSCNIEGRNSGHYNSMLFIWRVHSTTNKSVATQVEKYCHRYLREIGEPVREGTRGCFHIFNGNALKLVDVFLKERYSLLFHNNGGVK
jgi:hypothetical protein